MDPNSNEIVREFPGLFRLYKDGRVERLLGTETTPPGTDSLTGVQSKDITINSDTGIGARLYLPPNATASQKLPILIYIHGGAFCICSPFNTGYHHHLNTVAAQANVIVFSVHYRKFQEILKFQEEQISLDTLQMAERFINFDSATLKTFSEKEQFKTSLRHQLKEEETCLIDNIWNLQTTTQGNSKKVAVINALVSYLSTGRHFSKKPFICYNLYTGTKAGVYLDWEEMTLLIEEIKLFPRYGQPIYKGFYDIKEAIDSVTKICGNDIIISPKVIKYQNYLKHMENFDDQEFLLEIQKTDPKVKGKEISLRPQIPQKEQKSFSETLNSTKVQKGSTNLVQLGKPVISLQPKLSSEELSITTFILIQEALAKIDNTKNTYNGIATEWSYVFNHCQLDSAIRKARISLPLFKPFKVRDYNITITNLLKHGLISTINTTPLYDFTPYLSSFLADTLEVVTSEFPQKIKLEINSLYPDFHHNYPCVHMIWMYFKDIDMKYEEFQNQNFGPKDINLEDLYQQIELARAKLISEDFGWSKEKIEDKNLLREDKSEKKICNTEVARSCFFSFEVKHSRPKLVDAYKRRNTNYSKKPGSSGSSQDRSTIMIDP